MKKLRCEIEQGFSHIDIENMSNKEYSEWFFTAFLPLMLMKWMGEIETMNDGSGSFVPHTLDSIREEITDLVAIFYNECFH